MVSQGYDDYKRNEHWKVVNHLGRVTSTTPQMLWDKATAYFKWSDDNPIKAKRTLQAGKDAGRQVEIEFTRPYSVKAFCLHANISERWIGDIKRNNDANSEWVIILEKILMLIYTQNLEGAVVDIYNPIMVSKVLNMDKGVGGDDDKPTRVEIVYSEKGNLPNSENEVLKRLDFGKVEILKEKTENPER